MKRIKVLFTCLFALALHSGAWAEVYETKDAEGNTEFTDSPPLEKAKEINVGPTNLADAPQQQHGQASQPQEGSPQQAPVQQNNTVIIHNGDNGQQDDDELDNDQLVGDQLQDDAWRRQRAAEAVDPNAPHEVGDSADQMPREVGDSADQMPHEVGDFDTSRRAEAAEKGVPADAGMREEANREYRH
jgi:hypothetical protein